jgi:biopolymer transport protein ExbD
MRGHTSPRLARRRREPQRSELMLAAMVDMMINILLFLLQLYGNSAITIQPSPDLELARSSARDQVQWAVSLVVSRNAVRLADKDIGSFPAQNRAPSQAEYEALVHALGDERSKVQVRARDHMAPTEVVVQADKHLSWQVLGPVMRAASDAGFANVRFVVAVEGEPDAG